MRAETAADHFHSARLVGAGFPRPEAGLEDKLEPPFKTHYQETTTSAE
jgi:hypothetical protein